MNLCYKQVQGNLSISLRIREEVVIITQGCLCGERSKSKETGLKAGSFSEVVLNFPTWPNSPRIQVQILEAKLGFESELLRLGLNLAPGNVHFCKSSSE